MYIYANSINKHIAGVTLHKPGVKHLSSLWFKGSGLLVPYVDNSPMWTLRVDMGKKCGVFHSSKRET